MKVILLFLASRRATEVSNATLILVFYNTPLPPLLVGSSSLPQCFEISWWPALVWLFIYLLYYASYSVVPLRLEIISFSSRKSSWMTSLIIFSLSFLGTHKFKCWNFWCGLNFIFLSNIFFLCIFALCFGGIASIYSPHIIWLFDFCIIYFMPNIFFVPWKFPFS